jgi:hypothetical protein
MRLIAAKSFMCFFGCISMEKPTSHTDDILPLCIPPDIQSMSWSWAVAHIALLD